MVVKLDLTLGLRLFNFSLGTRISLSLYGWLSSGDGSTVSLPTLAGFPEGYYGNHFVCLFHLLSVFLLDSVEQEGEYWMIGLGLL
jgi:hypothetical protein